MNKIGHVLLCAPNEITVAIESLKAFEEHKANLQVGRYLQIAQGNNDYPNLSRILEACGFMRNGRNFGAT